MDFVVVLHPFSDRSEGGRRIRDWVYADIISFEGLYEGLSHPVALGALDRGEAGRETKGDPDLDSLCGGIDRAIVSQPFDWMGCSDSPEPAFDALYASGEDRLAGSEANR